MNKKAFGRFSINSSQNLLSVFDNLFLFLKSYGLLRLSFLTLGKVCRKTKRILLFNEKKIFSLIRQKENFQSSFCLISDEILIIDETINFILKSIYEPLFFSSNINYDLNNFCQNNQKILSLILYQIKDLNVILNGDFSSNSNDFCVKTFIKILNKKILDKRFLKLVYTFSKFSLFYQFNNLYIRSSQSYTSFFENVCFFELDYFIFIHIFSLFVSINKKKLSFISELEINLRFLPFYKPSLLKSHYFLLKDFNKKLSAKKFLFSFSNKLKIFLVRRKFASTSRLFLKNFFSKYYYFRYASNWYFFYSDSFLKFFVKNKILFFLRIYLNIDLELMNIYSLNLVKKNFHFLGFNIKKDSHRIILDLDINFLVKEFLLWGFMKKNKGKFKPTEISLWSTFSDYAIILKYNAIIRGLVSYFSFLIKKKSDLKFFIYVLEYSCYKTFSQKHKSTVKKILKKYGNPLSSSILQSKNDLKMIKTVTLLNVSNYWSYLKKILDFSLLVKLNF